MLTVVVTEAAPDRVRGFLSSAMLEVAAGTYVSVHLTAKARALVWAEIEPFFQHAGYALMVCEDPKAPERLSLSAVGIPKRAFFQFDGLTLAGWPAQS